MQYMIYGYRLAALPFAFDVLMLLPRPQSFLFVLVYFVNLCSARGRKSSCRTIVIQGYELAVVQFAFAAPTLLASLEALFWNVCGFCKVMLCKGWDIVMQDYCRSRCCPHLPLRPQLFFQNSSSKASILRVMLCVRLSQYIKHRSHFTALLSFNTLTILSSLS